MNHSYQVSRDQLLANDGEFFTKVSIPSGTLEAWQKEYPSKLKRYVELSGLEPYEFHAEEDIGKLVDALVAGAKDTYIYPVTHVYNPRKMIQYGLWPTTLPTNSSWVQDWLNGMDLATILFWAVEQKGGYYGRILETVHQAARWQYRTMETIRRDAIESANGMLLNIYAPDQIYRISHRPKTDMSLFRHPTSNRAYRDQIRNGKITLGGEEWNVIPVTRYSKGMRRSLFFGGGEVGDREFCGTFYYGEPESTTLLAYQTSLRAFNKTDAMNKLGRELPSPITEDWTEDEVYAYEYHEGKQILRLRDHISGKYPRDLMLTPQEAMKLYWNPSSEYRIRSKSDPLYGREDVLSFEKHYAGEYFDLYAAEDYLDQPLCLAAKEDGLDIVILENMVGSFQVVTEVLDTRSREDSFRSLVYIID